MNFTEALDRIKNAIYGKDVRQAMVDAVQAVYTDAAVAGNANLEVTQARGLYGSLNERLNADRDGVFLRVYPVGSIYTSVNSANPSAIFGGTWVAFGAGRTMVGVDTNDTSFNTVEKTGGEKNHTLTVAEMPAHKHAASDTAGYYAYGGVSGSIAQGTGYNTQLTSINTGSTGGGQAHNNLQPYITVYMWKRTA